MASRSQRAAIAKETVEIIERGSYVGPGGKVDLASSIARARAGTILYRPADFAAFERSPASRFGSRVATVFDVRNETTLAAAARLTREFDPARVAALNFASARHAGGGFLTGAQAQEESLARASALYACLQARRELYELPEHTRSCLYSDHMIYAPRVSVFRDDHDSLQAQPYEVSFITSPAVNVGALRQNTPGLVNQIEPVMRGRIEKVLQVALRHGHDVLILGAWGCGVFKNSPRLIAEWFFDQLGPGGPFATAFTHVAFAVLDRSESAEIIAPFRERFQPA